MPFQDDHLLRNPEAAAHIGVSSKTLRNWRFRGIAPPAVKLNGAVRYRRSDLDRWVEARVEGGEVA